MYEQAPRSMGDHSPRSCQTRHIGRENQRYCSDNSACPQSRALEYWTNYLEGCYPCCFPQLNEQSTTPGGRLEARSVKVPLTSDSQIHVFCQEMGVTVSAVLLLAWGLVLRVFTGTDSVCFGYMVSGSETTVPGTECDEGPLHLICRLDIAENLAISQMILKAQGDFKKSLAVGSLPPLAVWRSKGLPDAAHFNTCMAFVTATVNGTENNPLATEGVTYTSQDQVCHPYHCCQPVSGRSHNLPKESTDNHIYSMNFSWSATSRRLRL
jgi:hypothetical protein